MASTARKTRGTMFRLRITRLASNQVRKYCFNKYKLRWWYKSFSISSRIYVVLFIVIFSFLPSREFPEISLYFREKLFPSKESSLKIESAAESIYFKKASLLQHENCVFLASTARTIRSHYIHERKLPKVTWNNDGIDSPYYKGYISIYALTHRRCVPVRLRCWHVASARIGH